MFFVKINQILTNITLAYNVIFLQNAKGLYLGVGRRTAGRVSQLDDSGGLRCGI